MPETLTVTLETVKGLIKQELDMADLPVNETFGNLGMQAYQINRIQSCIVKAFQKNVRPLWGDTVYSFTQRILNETPAPKKS